MDLLPLTSTSQFDDIDFRSHLKKQVILKHSTRCFISIIVLKKVKAELSQAKEPIDFDIYYLDLLKFREISNMAAERYNVHHESPQLLVIEKARCIYNSSHNEVSMKNAGVL